MMTMKVTMKMTKFRLLKLVPILAILGLVSACSRYVSHSAQYQIYKHKATRAFMDNTNFDDPAHAKYIDGDMFLGMNFSHTAANGTAWNARLNVMSTDPGQSIYIKSADLKYLGRVERKEVEQNYTLSDGGFYDVNQKRIYQAIIVFFDDIVIEGYGKGSPSVYIDVTYEKDGEIKTLSYEIEDASFMGSPI